jgi:hypothetical protein
MRGIGFVLSALLLIAVLGAFTNGPDEREFQASGNKRPMTADEIRKAFVGNSLTGTAKDGTKFFTYYPDETTLRGVWRKGAYVDRDSGTWSVTKDVLYCSTWKKLRKGTEKCWHIYLGKDGDLTWFLPDGTNDDDDSRLVPGNPGGL